MARTNFLARSSEHDQVTFSSDIRSMADLVSDHINDKHYDL